MSRERTFRSEAIVLKRTNIGEADRLLTLFSREQGKIKAIAKGARKPQSRKTGHVELFMRSQFLFATGKEMSIITQAEMIDAYPALRDDLVRTTYAAYVVELLDKFTVEEERHLGMYQLLADTLGWLVEHTDLLLVARYFELHLMDFTGFRPQLFTCMGCGEPIQEQDQFFSAELGGVLCPTCQTADPRAKPITAVAIKVLRYLQTRSWDTVKLLQLKRPLHTELETIMHSYITHILERHLKSVDFLHRLRLEANLFLPHQDDQSLDPLQ
jgi:DNA repair protein RecO (recombination protein O)